MVMRTRISGSITRIVLGDVSLGLWSSTGMSGERQQRERVLGAFNSERRVSGSAEGRTDVRSRPGVATRLGKVLLAIIVGRERVPSFERDAQDLKEAKALLQELGRLSQPKLSGSHNAGRARRRP